jgi:AraC-like DNA-binding protein/TolB-like protein/tetratricopeptide (TPR) repeat protein
MDMTHKDWSSLQVGGPALPRDIKVAINYMRESIGQQICIADIVATTGTPERTLRKHFLMFFGLAPLRFFRRLRLAAARDALLAISSDSVTETAARFGFAHFGRFSRDYRRCFGELPSATRRRERLFDQLYDPSSPRAILAPYFAVTMPMLVIVPFRTNGDRESNCLADGLGELLAAELARGCALSVTLAPATGVLATRRLGARYCLMGRVACLAARVRVIVRLIDVEEDRHLWGDSFDGNAGDELTLQDLVVGGVLREVGPRILGEQIERARRADRGALTGSEIALRALPLALLPSPNRSEQAVDLLDHAMMLAPDCALAVALAGWCRARSAIVAWNRNAPEQRTKGCRMADQAGILAPADPMVLAIRASIAHLAGQYAAAESLAARAVAMDPACALGWDRLGWVYEATNRLDDAMPLFARVERIPAPYLDRAASLDGVGTAHFSAGRYKAAELVLRTAALVRPGSSGLHGKLAACYVQLGDKAAARTHLAILRRIVPDGVSAEQYVNSYPCGIDSFKNALTNSLIDIEMPA